MIIKGIKDIINIVMSERLKFERHEFQYGPHFNEEYAYKAVLHLTNEDGSIGPHYSMELALLLANKYGADLHTEDFNRYDWYVALNMIYSDFYKAVVNLTNTTNDKYFVELTKNWLNDEDASEGKMWHYYCYIMCNKLKDYTGYSVGDEADYYMPRYRRSSRY